VSPYELNQVVKTQQIRLVDVFVLGPLMIYAAGLIPQKHAPVRAALALFGASTIIYNFRNYNRVRRSDAGGGA
jgi:hypothetical protein